MAISRLAESSKGQCFYAPGDWFGLRPVNDSGRAGVVGAANRINGAAIDRLVNRLSQDAIMVVEAKE